MAQYFENCRQPHIQPEDVKVNINAREAGRLFASIIRAIYTLSSTGIPLREPLADQLFPKEIFAGFYLLKRAGLMNNQQIFTLVQALITKRKALTTINIGRGLVPLLKTAEADKYLVAAFKLSDTTR